MIAFVLQIWPEELMHQGNDISLHGENSWLKGWRHKQTASKNFPIKCNAGASILFQDNIGKTTCPIYWSTTSSMCGPRSGEELPSKYMTCYHHGQGTWNWVGSGRLESVLNEWDLAGNLIKVKWSRIDGLKRKFFLVHSLCRNSKKESQDHKVFIIAH